MAIRSTRPRVTADLEAQAPIWLVDDMLECYIKWRVAARAERDAYEDWASVTGPGVERGLWLGAYVAAVDQEEAAACSYARAVRAIELQLTR